MLELLNTIFAGGTLFVFGVTATIALVQLRHLRASYQLTAGGTLLQAYWSPQFQEWLHYVDFDLAQRLTDHGFREELKHPPIDRTRHPEIYICEYYTLLGSYIRHRLLPIDVFFDSGGGRAALDYWARLSPVVQLVRDGDPHAYENFEYLADFGKRWFAVHRRGIHP